MFDGQSIFIKYWFIGEPLISMIQGTYYLSILPGMKEGISSSIISGNNIGIIKNIPEDRKEAALEVLKFFTSKEYQKEKFGDKTFITGIDELWSDEEACGNGFCDIVKSTQYTPEPEFLREGNDDYRKRYKKYLYELLYNNITVEETLKRINDIKDIYYISVDIKNSYVGLICFILFSVLSILMISSIIFLFRENFRPFIMFLPDGFWVITILGSIFILWVPLISYGPVNTLKCHMKTLLLSIGYTISVCPIMYKLIIQFPENNKLFTWIYRHKYLFLLYNILIDVLVNSVSLIDSCTIQKIFVEYGESFENCIYDGEYSIILLFIYKLVVIILILFLVFVEWNNSATMYDMRIIILALYIDIISITLIFVFYNIQIKNYISSFIVQAINTTIISLSNYILFYGIRILLGFMRKQNIKLEFINKINDSFINNETQLKSETFNSNNNNNSIYKSEVMNDSEDNENSESVTINRSSFIKRMINYHYLSKSYSSSTSSAYNTFSN